MERERLTAAAKGKAKMPEVEKKTKDQKVLQAAINAVHAADREGRSRGIEIRESTPSATEIPVQPPVRRSARLHSVPTGMGSTGTPGSTQSPSSSRKRTHADVEPIQKKAPVTPAPLLPEMDDGDEFLRLSSEVSRSIVTVEAVFEKANADYGTGFIVISEANYSLVFTSFPPDKSNVVEYFVHFEGGNVRTEAQILASYGGDFSILIVQTDRKYEHVVFSKDPLGSEFVFAIGAAGGIKFNFDGEIIGKLVGSLLTYRGKVVLPDYAASDVRFKPDDKAKMFFGVVCLAHDDIITLKNVDKRVRTSNSILSAPVFRFDGTVGGILYSCGHWIDVKTGLQANGVISLIQSIAKDKNWQEALKKSAHRWLVQSTNHNL